MENKNAVERFADGLCKVEKGIMNVFFLAMMVIMFIQVFARYVLHTPLAWTEEVMRFSFILASFFGAAVCTHTRKHVVINFLSIIVTKITKDEKKQNVIYAFFDLIFDAVCFCFCLWLTWMMFEYSLDLQAKNQLSTAMLFPMWYIGWGISASFVLTSFHFALNTAGSFKVFNQMRKGDAEA